MSLKDSSLSRQRGSTTLGLDVAMGSEINGLCDERLRPSEEAFQANFDCGYELGAALAVILGALLQAMLHDYCDTLRSVISGHAPSPLEPPS